MDVSELISFLEAIDQDATVYLAETDAPQDEGYKVEYISSSHYSNGGADVTLYFKRDEDL